MKVVLSSREDIKEELLKHDFIKECIVKRGREIGIADVYVTFSFFDYCFRLSKRLDEVYDILRPKLSFMVTPVVHTKFPKTFFYF